MPGDVEIVAAAMKRDRKARLAVPICPSTFEADIASMHGMLIAYIDKLTSSFYDDSSMPFQPSLARAGHERKGW